MLHRRRRLARLTYAIGDQLLDGAARAERGEVVGTPAEVLLVDVGVVVPARAAGPADPRRGPRHPPYGHLEGEVSIHRI